MFLDRLPAIRNRLAGLLLLAASQGCSPESPGPQLSAPEAHRRAQTGELTLIDIRRPEEWRQTGVAQGAVRIDLRQPGGGPGFADAVLRQVDGNRDAPIALICRTGNRTTQMQQVLLEQGFTQVYNIREGMAGSAAGPGWVRQGLPVEPCPRC